MAWKERDIERMYWSIGEVADMFGLAPSKIRFYEMEFGLTFRKNRRGERKYDGEDVDKLGLIIYLADHRFRLEYVKFLLNAGTAEQVRKCLQELEGNKTLKAEDLLKHPIENVKRQLKNNPIEDSTDDIYPCPQ